MIHIKLLVDDNQKYRQVIVTGHAEYADHGYDIVCAAVSSQLISVENSLHQLVKIPVLTEVDEVAGGYLKITLPEDSTTQQAEMAQFLFEHLNLALSTIADSYSDFVKINYSNFKP